MKKVVFFVIVSLFLMNNISWAQTADSLSLINEVSVDAETDNGFFDDLYLGSLMAGSFHNDQYGNPSYNTNINLRVGAAKNFILPVGEITLMGTYDNAGEGIYMSQVKWHMDINKTISVRAGAMSRPICFLHRPWPPTPASHFEPPALAVIPGGSIGAGIDIHINDNNTLYLGSYQAKEYYNEINLGYAVTLNEGWSWTLAGSYATAAKFDYVDWNDWNVASSVHKKDHLDITVYAGEEIGTTTYSAFINICLSNGICPYFVGVYRPNGLAGAYRPNSFDKNQNLEIGFTKTIDTGHKLWNTEASVLVGAGYVRYPVPSFNVYLQFYLYGGKN